MTKQQRLILVISIMASFVSGLDGFIVNVALPTISRELGGGLVVQQWVVDAYLITLGSLILIAGSLSDLFGRKRVLVGGLIGFGTASLLCSLAPNSSFLIVSRGLQGIAGALLVPSSLALIISTFSGKAQSKAIGTWTAWFSIAAVIGPLIGGLIIAISSWRWIFAINVLPITITLWLFKKIPKFEGETRPKVDILGAIFCVLGLGSSVFALIEQPRYGWASPSIYIPLCIGLVSLVTFVIYESRTPAPMMPLSLFTIRNFTAGNMATFAIYGGLGVAPFLLVIFLQQVGGFSALESGLALLPVTIIMFLLSPRFGALAGKLGPRPLMTAGPLIAGSGFLLMTRVNQHVQYTTRLLPGVLVFGLGLSMTVAPLTSAVLADVGSRHAGVASAVNNAVARIAGLITVALVGVIVGTHLDVYGFHHALILTAALVMLGGIVSAVGIRRVKTVA